ELPPNHGRETMKLKSILFGGAEISTTPGNLGLLFLRLVAGISLATAHGLGKLPPSEGFIKGVGERGFPAPVIFSWGAALSEALGGSLVALGLFTRPAAFFM